MSIAFEFASVLFSANASLSTRKRDATFPLPGEVKGDRATSLIQPRQSPPRGRLPSVLHAARSVRRHPMHVRDTVASRFSCRAFLPTPVPLATVRDIIDRAARAPSGGNLQPWRVPAVDGAPLEDLKAPTRPPPPPNSPGGGAPQPPYPAPLSG